MRINQYLARHTGLSRRTADQAITCGRVRVNGRSPAAGQTVGEGDKVSLDGQIINPTQLLYVALHKPVGYLSSRRSQGNSPTLYALIPPDLTHLKSVGRLDKDSSGLIILTNDGNFAQALTHPRYTKLKTYLVEVDRSLTAVDRTKLQAGVELDDGLSRLNLNRFGSAIEVGLTEGRNRQIRRTFAALGYSVTKLKRTHIGKLGLQDLQPGKYRFIKPEDVI